LSQLWQLILVVANRHQLASGQCQETGGCWSWWPFVNLFITILPVVGEPIAWTMIAVLITSLYAILVYYRPYCDLLVGQMIRRLMIDDVDCYRKSKKVDGNLPGSQIGHFEQALFPATIPPSQIDCRRFSTTSTVTFLPGVSTRLRLR